MQITYTKNERSAKITTNTKLEKKNANNRTAN